MKFCVGRSIGERKSSRLDRPEGTLCENRKFLLRRKLHVWTKEILEKVDSGHLEGKKARTAYVAARAMDPFSLALVRKAQMSMPLLPQLGHLATTPFLICSCCNAAILTTTSLSERPTEIFAWFSSPDLILRSPATGCNRTVLEMRLPLILDLIRLRSAFLLVSHFFLPRLSSTASPSPICSEPKNPIPHHFNT